MFMIANSMLFFLSAKREFNSASPLSTFGSALIISQLTQITLKQFSEANQHTLSFSSHSSVDF